MVRVEFNNETGEELQDFVIRDLKASINREIGQLRCESCNKPSRVVVTVKRNKLNRVNIRIEACCDDFGRKIDQALMYQYAD